MSRDSPATHCSTYDPAADQWWTIATPPFPQATQVEGFGAHSAVWTGSHLAVWAPAGYLSASGPQVRLYDPVDDGWELPIDAPAAPVTPVFVMGDDGSFVIGDRCAGSNQPSLVLGAEALNT